MKEQPGDMFFSSAMFICLLASAPAVRSPFPCWWVLLLSCVVLCLQLGSGLHVQFRRASEGHFGLMSEIKLFQNIKEERVNDADGSVCYFRAAHT